MKKFKTLIPAGLILVLSAYTTIESTNWVIADGHAINFSGTDAEGVFASMSGDVQWDEADLTASTCALKIDVNSINTGNGMKNKHAKSDKWFDAETYPYIEFISDTFTKTASGYEATGTLKMRGIEKEVTIPFTFEDDTFKAMFSVNRLDYEIGSMKGMMKKVSNEIKLDVSIPVTKN
ncbi:YceI family protein [Cryomorphaceae bacterium 1068]|nr:YceI family protein [Cryomorphaceae bacterium 1068]